MPRDGSNVYSKPAGTTAVAGTKIESAKFNSIVDDIATDLNTPRPIVAGGTGAASASAARTNLAVPGLADASTVSGNWTVSGAWTITGNPKYNDNVKAYFGTGQDAEVYFNATDFVVKASAGKMLLLGDNVWGLSADGLETLFTAVKNGAFSAYYDASVKLATSATGVTVTGALSATTAAGAWFLDEDNMASNSATKIPSQQSVKAYVDNLALGVGQTWQNVTASRAAGTSYQNTTGKPIVVAIRGDTNSTHYLQVSTDNATWVTVASTIASNANLSLIVPNGNYYRLTSGATFIGWSELR